jgi:hypothetical protein
MKKLQLALLLAFGAYQIASAQSLPTFVVYPNPSDTITTADTYDSPAKGEVKNLGSTPVTIKWERNIISLSPGIETAVCDPVTCWFPGIGTKVFTLGPEEHGEMTVHFYNPTGGAASGIVHLKLTNQNNPADTLTAVYTFSTLTSTGELPAATVKLFPNPSTDFFALTGAENVASMRLFALDGRQMARFEPNASQQYAIGHLPVGTYVLSLEDKNGQLFQAVELIKR